MDTPSTLAQIAGSVLAGAIGFFIGFYAGFFIVLSIWGLAVDEIAFVVITGVLGTLAAGGAIAFTVSEARRWGAFLTAVALGVVLVPLVLALDTDVVTIAVVGLFIVVVTSALVRTGAVDAITD
jgi:hypothetical protein